MSERERRDRDGQRERYRRYLERHDQRHDQRYDQRSRHAPRRTKPARAVVAGRALLSLASATLLVTSGLTWAAYHDLTSGMWTSNAINIVKPGERGYIAPHLDGSVNLLLIRLDSRKDMDGNDLPTSFVEDQLHAGSSGIGGHNTNVPILLPIPADRRHGTASSIPRADHRER